MKYGAKVKDCPRGCNAGAVFVRTPEIIHYGKMVCPKCGRFLDWVQKPHLTDPLRYEPEKIQPNGR